MGYKNGDNHTVVETLAVCNIDFIPNISVLLYIMAILPVTSASAEKGRGRERGKEGGREEREIGRDNPNLIL